MIYQKSFKRLNKHLLKQEERQLYEEHLKWLRIEVSKLEKAEKNARAKGIEEGKIEGKVEMARNLLKSGIPISVIAVASGLTEQEVLNLIQETSP